MFSRETDTDRADWPLLQNGAINLFWKQELFEEARRALEGLNYEILMVDCRSGWQTFQDQISTALKWREQFGYAPWNGNLDAFNDGLRDFPFGPSKQSALALRGFHVLVEEARDRADTVLDMLEYAARDHLLWSNVLIVLVQTDDPRYQCAPVGARHANWNRREWMDSNRGL
jgi:hypothetical protein